jgi:DNA-binding GntR family transcriptional regulator
MRAPAEASTLASEAYAIIRRRILEGDLKLGEPLSRRKLAADLRISFLPVSEAVFRLELEGLLESRARAGTRVRIPTSDDVRGHFLVREALEAQAAMVFAEVSTPAERADLRKLAAWVDTLSQQPNRALFVLQHQKFHFRIAECTRSAALCEAIEKTHALASIWFSVTQPSPDPQYHRLHQDLVDELLTGDPQRAAEAIRGHIRWGMRQALSHLEPYFQMRTASGRTFFRSDKRRQRYAASRLRVD